MRLAGVVIALVAWLPALALAGACPPPPPPTQATYQVLARAYKLLEAGKPGQARKMLKALSSTHHQVWFLRGVAAYQLRDYPGAARCFRAAIKAYRCFKDAWVNLGIALYSAGDPQQAAHAMLKGFELSDPPEYELLYRAGVMLLAAGKASMALKVLSRLEMIPRPNWRWLAALARAQMQLKRWGDATRVLMRALSLSPLQARVWRMLAGAYAGAGAWLKAATALEVAAWIRPPSTAAGWKELAQVWAGAGVAAKAAYYYRKAMDSPPTPGQLSHLAQLLARAGRLMQAQAAIAQAIRAEPTPRRWETAARLWMMQGQWKKAAKAFENAARLLKGRPAAAALLNAGWCWWNAGELAHAAAALRWAAASAPGSRTAATARRLMAQLHTYRKSLEAP